ncbi:MAG TPA: JAB domain-containing protein [Gemmatimonadaceae bacterium]|jgi:DNA repair protein RadC|nr:JAB domain-containing protein [Gemmatimonadaceae bacterium]
MILTRVPADDPVSRLIDLGPAALTSADLLSIILPPSLAPSRAAHVLAAADGSLRRLASDYATTLTALHTAVPSRHSARRHAAAVQAAFELGRRRAEEEHPARPRLTGPEAIAHLMAPRLMDRHVEEFHALALNAHHFLERDITITRGVLDSAPIDPRAAFREVLAERATSVAFVHNHPSGDPSPSAEDRAVTALLVAAGYILGVPVGDHVIIGHGRYYSFAQEGLL